MASNAKTYDVAIIGLGSTGMGAARVLKAAGKKVIAFDKGPRGTLCILKGCMPSKGLFVPTHHILHAKHYQNLLRGKANIDINIGKLFAQSRKWRDEFRDYRLEGENKLGITIIDGYAKLLDKNTVECDGNKYSAKNIIMSVGSKIFVPPIAGLEGTPYWTSDDVFELKENSFNGKKIGIIGGGVIGTEIGQLFIKLGFSVEIINRGDSLMSNFDEDMIQVLLGELKKQGIKFHFHSGPDKVVYKNKKFHVHFDDNRKGTYDHLLVTTGRRPIMVDGEGAAGIKRDERKRLIRNAKLQTSQKNIYTGGDMSGIPLLHEARQEGEFIGRHILGKEKKGYTTNNVQVVFSYPHIASVGKHEYQCEKGTYYAATVIFDDGRSMMEGLDHGSIKIVTDKKGVVLGCSCVNDMADYLVQMMIPYVQHKLNILDCTDMYHPTQPEIFLDLQDEIIAQMKSKRK
ncbi:MAG: pyruvate/2-oxoglutarate dehydrogenase complex dihydrolipoamide dehydrogenase (E3) component [Candidatus Woesearchaeota archaeon]|jgi:pyruvate/2-oxoglutarate dehydrogenase complex dihydrolipoamide dehydrogenase (E3) component